MELFGNLSTQTITGHEEFRVQGPCCSQNVQAAMVIVENQCDHTPKSLSPKPSTLKNALGQSESKPRSPEGA